MSRKLLGFRMEIEGNWAEGTGPGGGVGRRGGGQFVIAFLGLQLRKMAGILLLFIRLAVSR